MVQNPTFQHCTNIEELSKNAPKKRSKTNAQKDKELNFKINFVEHVYGPISGIHSYHAVPFRDLINLDHKKFDLRSTKANFIVGVRETAVKGTRSEFANRSLLKPQEILHLN